MNSIKIGLVSLFCIGLIFPTEAQPHRPSIHTINHAQKPDIKSFLSPDQMQAEITPFGKHINLDIAILLRAVLAKDKTLKPTQLKALLHKGWQASFDPNWESNAFTQVFHSYFYAYALNQKQPQSQAIQSQLKQINNTLKVSLKELKILPVQPNAHPPMFAPSSNRHPHYRFFFDQHHGKSQDYTWLYRSSASKVSTDKHELWAIDTLLEKPGSELAATGVWRKYHQNLKNHSKHLAFQQSAHEIEKELRFLKSQNLLHSELLQTINWDTGFRPDKVFFLSGDYTTSALYGSVIFIIQQEKMRGLALNEFGEKQGFYKNLPYRWLLSPKGFWIFALADKQEYILPSYIDHAEIKGVDIRGPRQLQHKGNRTGAPGHLLRKYRKYYSSQTGQVVILLDAQNRWMGSLSIGRLKRRPRIQLPPSPLTLPSKIKDKLPKNIIFTPTTG